MQVETQKASRFTKKFWLKAVGVLIVFSVIYNMGASGAKVEIKDKKVNYDELVKEIGAKEKEIKTVESDLKSIQKEYDSKSAEFEEAKKVVANKQAVEAEIAKLQGDLDKKKTEISEADKNIKSKQDELASITGQIKEKKSAPITLPAGHFEVGKDIPEGRYKAVAVGNGNFFVNDGMDANVMLGKGDFYEPEYVFFANAGDQIETTMQVKFIPVE